MEKKSVIVVATGANEDLQCGLMAASKCNVWFGSVMEAMVLSVGMQCGKTIASNALRRAVGVVVGVVDGKKGNCNGCAQTLSVRFGASVQIAIEVDTSDL